MEEGGLWKGKWWQSQEAGLQESDIEVQNMDTSALPLFTAMCFWKVFMNMSAQFEVCYSKSFSEGKHMHYKDVRYKINFHLWQQKTRAKGTAFLMLPTAEQFTFQGLIFSFILMHIYWIFRDEETPIRHKNENLN
jgi:hypothetical protein